MLTMQICFEDVFCGGMRLTETPELQNVLAELRRLRVNERV